MFWLSMLNLGMTKTVHSKFLPSTGETVISLRMGGNPCERLIIPCSRTMPVRHWISEAQIEKKISRADAAWTIRDWRS